MIMMILPWSPLLKFHKIPQNFLNFGLLPRKVKTFILQLLQYLAEIRKNIGVAFWNFQPHMVLF